MPKKREAAPNHAHSVDHDHAHSHEHPHVHSRGDAHDHTHNHSHTHDPKEIRRIVNRLSRSIGHLESVKRMVEDGKDCSDVLIQLAAVRAELNSTGKQLLKEHMEHCIVEAMEEQDSEALLKLHQAIDQFMK